MNVAVEREGDETSAKTCARHEPHIRVSAPSPLSLLVGGSFCGYLFSFYLDK